MPNEMKQGWQSIETAPKDGTAIVGWCHHASDPYHDGDRLTDYGANVEGLGHVEDGPHVIEWRASVWESQDEYGSGYWIPGCWYSPASEVAANPVAWMPLPAPPEPTP